jgi:hypothetical protein
VRIVIFFVSKPNKEPFLSIFSVVGNASYTRRHAKQGFEIYHLKLVEGRMEAMLFSSLKDIKEKKIQIWKFL